VNSENAAHLDLTFTQDESILGNLESFPRLTEDFLALVDHGASRPSKSSELHSKTSSRSVFPKKLSSD